MIIKFGNVKMDQQTHLNQNIALVNKVNYNVLVSHWYVSYLVYLKIQH
jgi:hypothetical protein